MSSRRRGDDADRASRDRTQNFNTPDDKDAAPSARPKPPTQDYTWPLANRSGNYPINLKRETSVRQRTRGHQNELVAQGWESRAPYEAAVGGVQYEWESPSPLATAAKKLIRLFAQAQMENRKGLRTVVGGYNEFYAIPLDNLPAKGVLEPFFLKFAQRFPAAGPTPVPGRTKRLGLRFPKQMGVTAYKEWLARRPYVKPGLRAWQETRLMLKAATAGIAPEVYATRFFTGDEALGVGLREGGLVVLMEAASSSLGDLLDTVSRASEPALITDFAISFEQLIYRASVDPELRLLLVDIKPGNVVVRLEGTPTAVTALTPLLIDFDEAFTYSYAGEEEMKPHCLYVVNMTMFILSSLCWLPDEEVPRKQWDTFLTVLQTKYRARVRDDPELVELARAGESGKPPEDSLLCRELADVMLYHREKSNLHDVMAETVDFYAVAKQLIYQATFYLTKNSDSFVKPCSKVRNFQFDDDEPIWEQFVRLANSDHARDRPAGAAPFQGRLVSSSA